MKRLIVAVVFLLVLISGCFGAYNALQRTTVQISSEVAYADTLALHAKYHDAHDALQSAYALWKRHHTLLGALVRHNELDTIENLFLRTLQSLADHADTEYRMHSRELQGMLAHIPEMEFPSILNIF